MANRGKKCYTCQEKIKKEKFVCYFYQKVLHITPECTDFDRNSLDVFIKCKANILNVCNQSLNKKEQGPKTDQKNDLIEIDTQLVETKDQMKTLTENINKSNALIETVKLEFNEVIKTKPQNFAASLGAVKMGKKIDTPPPVRSSATLEFA